MHYIQTPTKSIRPEELFDKLNKKFASKYNLSRLHKQTTVAKDGAIGCKVIPMKKRIMVSGNFATNRSMMLAAVILLIGGIIIPMGIYLFYYKPKFDAIEKEVYDFLVTQYVV